MLPDVNLRWNRKMIRRRKLFGLLAVVFLVFLLRAWLGLATRYGAELRGLTQLPAHSSRQERAHWGAGSFATRARVRTARRRCQSPRRVSGLPHTLERRRPRHPHPEASQGGVFEIAVVDRESLQGCRKR